MFQNAHYWYGNLNAGFRNKMQILFCLTVSLIGTGFDTVSYALDNVT